MTALLDPAVLLTLLIALAVGFALGRFTARGRSDPSDVSRLRRQASPHAAAPSVTAFAASSAPPPGTPLSIDLSPEAVRHLQNGALISAIKVFKDANPGLGLKQAKDIVEDYQRRNGLT